MMALWVATPKVYVHNLLNHNHDTSIEVDGETKLQEKSTDDCNFEKYNTPSHFNVFKFLNSFIPSKPQSIIRTQKTSTNFAVKSNAIYLLRAPPTKA
jgi:hypothetical protein